MPDQESIQFDVDPRSVLGAIKQMNAAMESYEKGSTSANTNLQKAIERTSDILLKVNDRSRTSMERLTQSIEKQAAAYGKTNAERMVAERDRIIKKLGDEQGMIERVNAAYAKMLAADAAGQGAAGIQSMGFAAQQSKASLALMGEEIGVHIPRQLRTFITMLPGVGQALETSFKAVAIIALIVVIYEAVKKVLELRKAMEDMRVASERARAEFTRFNDSQKLANDELLVTNDRLENAIAKLQHKPENNLKTAIDEAAVAALNLSDRMDKSLRSFAELAQKNAPGTFAEILGRQAGTKDITELIQGKGGFGGMIGEVYAATNTGGDPTGVLSAYRARVQRLLETAVQNKAFQEGRLIGGGNIQTQPGQPVTYNPALGPVESTAQQGPRIEVLNALMRQIDILTQSYALEKQHAVLQNTENQLKDALSKSGAFVITDAQMEKIQAAAPVISGRPSLYPRSAALANASALGWQAEVTVTQAEIDKANGPMEAAQKAQMEARWKGEEDLIKKTDAERLSSIATEAKYTERALELRKGPGGEIELARAVAAVREDALRKEFDLTGDAVKYREQSLANERDMRVKIAEIEIKQHDELAKTATTLWNTLLTKPQDFGKQLGATLHGAILKPVTEGLGNLTANALGPLIFGENGVGGVAGLFGGVFGRNDPIKTATDQNTLATRQNSQAMYVMSALLARASGVSLSSLPTPTFVPGMGTLPKFAEGGVTNGPTIVGEAGPELVIPLSARRFGLRPTMNRPLVGAYGPETDAALLKVFTGLSAVGLAGGLSMLGGPAAYEAGTTLMTLLTGAVAAMTPDRRDNVLEGIMPVGPGGGGRYSVPEEGRSLFNKGTYEDLKAIGSKGGRISGLRRSQAAAQRDALRAVAQAMRAEERDALMADKGLFSNAKYKGPKDWDIAEDVHEASLKLDEQFPHLRDIFKRSEGQQAALDKMKAAKQGEPFGGAKTAEEAAALARKGASVRAPRDVADLRIPIMKRGTNLQDAQGYLRWFIDPRTDEVHLGPFVPEGADDPAGFETHADWFETIKYPRTTRFDAIPKGYAQVHGGKFNILDNGMEPEMYLAPPLSNNQYSALMKTLSKTLRLPSYDEGGTVAQTGMAVVHQGEAVVPSADTLKRAIDLNTAAVQRSAEAARASATQMAMMAANITGWLLAGIGVAMPSFAAGGGVPGNLLSAGLGATGAPGGDLAAISSVSSAVGGPGGTSGFAGPVGGIAPGGGGTDIYNLPLAPHSALASILRSGSRPGGIFSRAGFANLKGAFGIGGTPQAVGLYGDTISTGTTFKSVLESKGGKSLEMAGGMMLAQQGLLGSSRGTWGGVAEGTAGGAAIGMSIGGPLGAAIGAAAGFGIGIGEKLAGVESPENKAKRLVKQLYSISIDNNLAKQIAGIAQQSYGGNLDMAVRTQQVRELVLLYAQTMGQKTSLTALMAHQASLIESGGKLYQGAVYDNGQAYTYGSAFPTYGGIPSQNLPTASPYAGGTTIMLNPQQTVDLWRTGTAQAISGNPRAVASSALAGSQASAARAGNAVTSFAPSVITQ